jgi:hypothetical protein
LKDNGSLTGAGRVTWCPAYDVEEDERGTFADLINLFLINTVDTVVRNVLEGDKIAPTSETKEDKANMVALQVTVGKG